MTTLKALEIWTVQSICDAGILLSVVSWLLYMARPYFRRVRGDLPLRIAADMWWIWYVIVRDGTLLAAFLAGLWTLNLDLMADIKIGLPFVPAATVVLALTLVLKVFGESADEGSAYRRVTVLVTLAAGLNLIGYVFVMEGPGPEYAAADTLFWRTLVGWRSNANPVLSLYTFSATASALGLLAVVTGVRAFRQLGAEGPGPVTALSHEPPPTRLRPSA